MLLALGGTAYAVNTVRSADIVDGAVKTQDIGTGEVRTADIQNGGVGTIDVAAASLGRSRRLWAQVTQEGSAAREVGVTAAERASEGVFEVTFERNVFNCAVAVTPHGNDAVMTSYESAGAVVTYRIYDTDGFAEDQAADIIVVC